MPSYRPQPRIQLRSPIRDLMEESHKSGIEIRVAGFRESGLDRIICELRFAKEMKPTILSREVGLALLGFSALDLA